jgi:SAM-dependent methyltransferase
MKNKIRKQIYNLIPKNSKVIDIGCGKGKLLNYLSKKINYGLGIDIKKLNVSKKDNLEFKTINSKNIIGNFDYSIAMFSLHSMNYATQIKTLENMKKISKKIILIDLILPKNIFYKKLISFDEILAGHYKNFKNYKKIGMEKLILNSGLKIKKEIKHKIYSIWICK